MNVNNKYSFITALIFAILLVELKSEITEIPESNIHENVILEEKIYVSFTSWPKRIQNCKHTIDLMMNQTLLPSRIILNLSEEEFLNKENDLPKDWYRKSNTMNYLKFSRLKKILPFFKKIIPTMNRFPNDFSFIY